MNVRKFNTVYPVNTKINGDKLRGDEWTALSQAAHDVQTKVNEIIDAISSEQHGETSSVLTPQMFGAVGGSSFNVTNAAADTAAFKALANAVSVEGSEKRVYIPAGHYVLNERVDFVDSCYVYGDGESTVIDCINGAGGITFGYKNNSATGSCTQLTNTITADAAKGDSVITLNSVSNLAVGMYLIISDTEDYSFNLSRPYFRTSEVVKVAAINGNTVTLAGVLAGKYFTGRTVISKFEPQSFVVKDLKIVSHEATSYSTYYTFLACGIVNSVFENVVVENYGNHTAGLIAYGVNYRVEHCTFGNHVDNASLYDVYGLAIQSGQDFIIIDSTFRGGEGRGDGEGNDRHCHGLATGSNESAFAFNNRYFVYQRLHFDASEVGAIDLDVHGCSENYKFVDIYAPNVACDTGGYNVTIEGCTFDRITNTFNCDGVRIVNCEIMNYTNTGKMLWSNSQAVPERKFGNFVLLNNRIHGAYWIDFQQAINNQGEHGITNFVFCGNFADYLRLDYGYIANIVVEGNTFTNGGFATASMSMDSVVVRNNTFVNGCLQVTSNNVRAFCDISNNVINHITATEGLADDYTVMLQNADGVIKGNSIKRALVGRRPVFIIGRGSNIKVEDNYIHAAVVGRELLYLRDNSRAVFVNNTYNSTSVKDAQGILVEEDGAKFGVKRIGTTAERPIGGDIYVGFEYIDTDEGKAVFAVAINGDDVTWTTWGNEAAAPVEPEPEPVPVTGFTISGPSDIIGTGVRTYRITDITPSNYTVGIQSIAVTSDSDFDINVVSASEFNIDVNRASGNAYTINITVAATLADGTVVTETKAVDVAASAPAQIPVTGFSISGQTAINEAGSYDYTITDVVPANANVGISSLVVSGNIMSTNVTANGFTLHVRDIPVGTQTTETITVKAILTSNAEITRSIDITLTGAEAVPVTDFSILGADTISESGTYHYTIGNVIPSEPNVGIKRIDVNSNVGTVDTVANNGFNLTVQQDSVAVTATITVVATLDDDSTLTRTKTVTIEAAVIPATDFSISGPDMIGSTGNTQFNVVASPANANVGFKSVAVDAGDLTTTVNTMQQQTNGSVPFNVAVNNLDGTVEVPVTVTVTLNDDSEVEHTKTVKLRQPAPAVSTVDLGLASGNLWATANIGATNPEDRGYYFTWGNTDGYTETNMQEFTADSYASTPGKQQGFRIEPIQDAARSYLGSEYLIPTKEDYEELIAGCDWVADTINGVKVFRGTSKVNSNIIIFPRVGNLDASGNIQYDNAGGYYFTSNSEDVAGRSAIRTDIDNNGLHQPDNANKYNTSTLRAIKRSTPVAVDLGLPSGKLWSDRNVGAVSPTDNGQYCSYGNILGHYKDLSSYVNLSEVYANTAGGELTSSFTSGDAAHDIVKAVCGGSWRMPTIQEWQELLNAENTTTEWTTVDGVNGLRITSKANGNSIFLPASGRIAPQGRFVNEGTVGAYCSTAMHSNGLSQYDVWITENSISAQDTNGRAYCFAVRGIMNAE